MNQKDWSDLLKAKLDDRNPKCGNCRFWDREHPGRIRPCRAATDSYGIGIITMTTDLSLCSAWEKAPSKPDPE